MAVSTCVNLPNRDKLSLDRGARKCNKFTCQVVARSLLHATCLSGLPCDLATDVQHLPHPQPSSKAHPNNEPQLCRSIAVFALFCCFSPLTLFQEVESRLTKFEACAWVSSTFGNVILEYLLLQLHGHTEECAASFHRICQCKDLLHKGRCMVWAFL